jgi:hypothetical protein
MKTKVLNGLLILTSLLGYLEWAGNNHLFLFQAEADILTKSITDPKSVLHPFVLLPIIGQILLLISLFQKTPHKALTFIGIGTLGILLAFMFFIGVISLNFKIFFSTIPFLAMAIYSIIYHKKTKPV